MKRKIGIIIGSTSDLAQCAQGLKFLTEAVQRKAVEVMWVKAMSIHRNTDEVLRVLRILNALPVDIQPDALIIGAGWANHLTGTADAYLRYTLHNTKIVVVGVAFEDPREPKHTEAARLSITEVPGTQVVFNDLVGPEGFEAACRFVVAGKLPTIILKEPKPPREFSLEEAFLRLAIDKQ